MKIQLDNIANPSNLSTLNDNFSKIEDALNNNVLYRENIDGEPNEMRDDLDVNGKRIYNLPEPLLPSEAARLQDVLDALGEGPQGFVPLSDLANTDDVSKGDALIGVKQPFVGAVGLTQHDKNSDVVSVTDFGAGAGGDDTAAFSAAAKGAIAATNQIPTFAWLSSAPLVRVMVPAGNYTLTSTVDTGGREVIWTLDGGSHITGYAFLNGRLERPGQKLNHPTHGILDYAAGYSFSVNGDLEVPAQILGFGSAAALGTYTDRDSVTVYMDNLGPPIQADIATATYTATTIVPGTPLTTSQVRKLRSGMIIDTKHATKYSGFITGWAADGSSITVSSWYLSPGPGTPATPANGTGAYVNPVTKVWGQNTNVYLTSTSHASHACGYELGVFNNKSAPAAAGDDPKVWGMDVVNLGTYKCEAAHVARGPFFYGFQSIDSDVGFRYQGNGNALTSATSGGVTDFQIFNGNVEAGKTSVAGTVTYDFRSSGVSGNDYDVRLQSTGGSATPGSGTFSVIAASVQLPVAGAFLEMGSTSVAGASFIDFHSSGNANDYDARISVGGGTASNGQGIIGLNAAQISITQGLLNFANDAAAAAGGVGLNRLYRNGSVVMIRVV